MSRRVSGELVTLLAAVATVLADVALASLVHGPALPLVWVAGALIASAVAGRARRGADPLVEARGRLAPIRVADLGVGAHVALAAGHALASDAPLAAVGAGGLGLLGTGVLLVIAAGCLAAGRVAAWPGPARLAGDALGLAAVAYLLACRLDGAALAVAWAGESVALAGIAWRTREPAAAWAALAGLVLAGAHALVFEAPPAALADGLAAPAGALAALAAFAAGAVALGRTRPVVGTVAGWTRIEPRVVRGLLFATAALATLYLTSVELVGTVMAAPDDGVALLDARQRSQMLLSALWAVSGTGALLAGLRSDRRPIRLGGLALLLVSAAKVFVLDLSALDSGWRVGSFLVLGLLLLGGAFAWQRLRPRALPDLRETPAALR